MGRPWPTRGFCATGNKRPVTKSALIKKTYMQTKKKQIPKKQKHSM
jgi:hypothetical protein